MQLNFLFYILVFQIHALYLMMYAAFSNYKGLNSEQMTAVGVLICERWERPFFVCDYWVEPRMSARVLNSE